MYDLHEHTQQKSLWTDNAGTTEQKVIAAGGHAIAVKPLVCHCRLLITATSQNHKKIYLKFLSLHETKFLNM